MDVFPTGSPETWWITNSSALGSPRNTLLKSQNLALTGEKKVPSKTKIMIDYTTDSVNYYKLILI